MSQKQTLPNNSPNESSQLDPEIQEAIAESKIAASLYYQHRLELNMWAEIYNEPWKLNTLQAEALIGAIKDLSSKFGLDVIAMEMEDIIAEQLLPMVASNEELTMSDRREIALKIEQLMKVSRAFRFIEQNIIPYTRI